MSGKVIQCDEASTQENAHPNAVWVPKGDVLYYYNVDSCLTVTLVFDNGVAGGHVGMQAPNNTKPEPAKNLLDVINKIKTVTDKTDNTGDTGELLRVEYVGNLDNAEWNINNALQTIKQRYRCSSSFKSDESSESSPKDIVFDTGDNKMYTANHVKGQTAKRLVKTQLQEQQKFFLDDNLEAQGKKLEEIAKYKDNQELNQAVEKVRTDLNKLTNALPGKELNEAITDIKAALPNISNKIDSLKEKLKSAKMKEFENIKQELEKQDAEIKIDTEEDAKIDTKIEKEVETWSVE